MSQDYTLDATRRRALAQLSAASLAALSPWAWAQKPLTVGVIYVGPKDDFGYNQAQAEAAAEVKKMAGMKASDVDRGRSTRRSPPSCCRPSRRWASTPSAST